MILLPKLNNVQYMSIIDAQVQGITISKLDEKSSYLTTFMWPFGQYQYKCLPFWSSGSRQHVPVQNR